jgi:fluoroacetyl-CoA thioesterase
MSNSSETANATSDGVGTSLSRNFTVEEKNTVGFMVPGMPMVAATPYLVGITELTCYDIVKPMLEPGVVTVGTRVVIDHLGASKAGSTLVVDATLRSREKNRYHFTATITDGARTVARLEHVRAAVSMQKLTGGLG